MNPDADLPPPWPDELQAVFREARGRVWKTEAEVQAFVSRRMAEYNATPQPELGGLSPQQAASLFSGDWETSGALRLPSLPAVDVADAPILKDARVVLETLAEQPLSATATGNLNRAAVRLLLDRGATQDPWLDDLRAKNRAINELEAFPLHLVRITCELGHLLRRARGAFRITRRGRELVAGDRAGELFRTLFITYHRDLNHEYVSRGWPNPALQQTVAFCFHQLGRLARDWVTPEAIAADAVLPAAHPRQDPGGFDELAIQFSARVVHPLVRFGLLERRPLPGRASELGDHEIRKTPVFDRFLRFEL